MNSERSIIESLRLTARDMSCDMPGLEKARSMIGTSLGEILTAMGVSDIEQAKQVYRKHYYDFILEEEPYPGMKKLIRTLHNRVLMSIATNKGLTGSRMTLDNNDLLQYFDILVTVDEGFSKPDPRVWYLIRDYYREQGKPLEAGDCLMVGDSPTDARFAHDCGMDYAHTSWGFYPIEDLPFTPRYHITDPAQLLDILTEPLALEITSEIDLHRFPPEQQMDVVSSYLEEARARGLKELRIIHGKGRGVQREHLHKLLDKRSDIDSYTDAPPWLGGLGATLVVLKETFS